MNLAVLITCHNRQDKTLKCLESLYNSTLPKNCKYEVFLVDDGSTDGTSGAVELKFPNVHIIRGSGNLFWNGGMRLAWNHAAKNNFDFYLWLNDDTELKDSAIATILADSKKLKDKSIICGTCLSKKSVSITYGGYDEENHDIIVPNGKLQECYFFNGNIVLVPRTVFEIVGLLDSRFRHSLGDFDYGLRAGKHFIKSYVASEYLGFCESNELTIWCNPNYSFKDRISKFYGPLGISPFEHFIYAKRHFGLKKAIKSFLSQHLRLAYPSYWLKNKSV